MCTNELSRLRVLKIKAVELTGEGSGETGET